MLKNYFKTAWRNLIRHKIYSITNLVGLTIGLASVMLIMLYISDEISFDKFHTNGNRIYRVVHDALSPEGKEEKGGNTGGPQAAAFKEEIPEVEATCRFRGGWQELVKKDNEAISESITYADKNFFTMFSFPLIEGSADNVLNEWTNVVITEDIAKKYFNTTHAVGKTMEINQDGKFSTFTVTAVAKNTPVNSSIRFDFLLPIEKTLQDDWTKEWMTSFLNTFVLLKSNSNTKNVATKMCAILEQHTGEQMAEIKKKYPGVYYRYNLQPFLKMHLDKEYNAGNGLTAWSNASYSYILSGIALFILIIACINFINLTLARSLRRGKEVGIRKVAGSTRAQLIWQYIGESFILNSFAFIPALLLVQLCLPYFSELADKELSVSYLFHFKNLLLFLALILINTFLSGAYPALVLSGFKPVETLYGKLKLSGNNYLGKSLVVAQFVIAVFLIIGTVVMQKQFSFMLNKDVGYKPANIVDVGLPYEKIDQLNAFKNELAKYPYIKQTGAQSIPMTAMNTTAVEINHKEIFDVPFYKMDENMLPILQIEVVAGKNFLGIPADTNNCIINEAMVQAAGLKEPIGQKVSWNNHALNIIAVVKDFNTTSLKNKIMPCLIHQVPNNSYVQLMAKIDPTQKVMAIQTIQKVYKSFFPFYPCNYTFLDDEITNQYKADERWKTIVTFSAILSILISCLGLFGLAALSIAERTKEIGIRKVLGANVLGIAQLVSKQFLKLVIIGVIIASPIAWYFANKWLQDFAYRINIGWWIFLLAGGVAVLIALLTVSYQAIKAAIANPVKSLRTE
jgi:putative ABC transport system permease protein